MQQQIEAVFENGVFRPLRPVQLPEHQRVTVLLRADGENVEEEVGYEPLPLQQCKTIRVRVQRVGDLGPLPYPVDADELEPE